MKKKKAVTNQKKVKPTIGRDELFCQYFVNNDELRGNATHSYAEAYNYKLDTLSKDDAQRNEMGGIIVPSSYARAINVCGVLGHTLLRNPKIQQRLIELRNKLLRDEVVDAELAKVITQDTSIYAKVQGISEYNKLRSRITEKVDLTSKGEPISSITYAGPQE